MFFFLIKELRKSRNIKVQENELKIEFGLEGPSSFYQRGFIKEENKQGYSYELFRIAIQNSNHFQNIEVKITEIDPCPDYLDGRLPLWLQFQHEPITSRFIKVKPNDKIFVDIIQSVSSLKVSRLLLKHTVNGVPQDLPEAKYKIKIRASSENGYDEKCFIAGIEKLRLFMRYL